MRPLIFALTIAIGLASAPSAEAQLLRRIFNGNNQVFRQTTRVVTSCPGGVCPTVQRQVTRSSGHWSYPGDIASHLRSGHGVSTNGMSHSQMLNMHDALHEGRYQPQTTRVVAPKVNIAPVIVQPAQVPVAKPKPAASETFGLSSLVMPKHILGQFGGEIKAAEPVVAKVLEPVVDEQTFGLELGVKVEPTPSHVLGQFDGTVVAEEGSFKSALIKGIAAARKSGNITLMQALRLRIACLSPAFVERAQELAVVQIAFSGQSSEAVPVNDDGSINVEGINWEGLIKFMEAFIPLLITLLKAFGI